MAYTGSSTSQSDGGMGGLMREYYSKLALETLRPDLVIYDLAEKKPLPKNDGKTMIWHRYAEGTGMVSAYALTEGGSGAWPVWGALSANIVSATIKQYGRAVQTSDLLDLTAVSPVIEDAVKFLAAEAADIIERRTMETCMGTGSHSYSGTSISAASMMAVGGFPIVFSSARGDLVTKFSALTCTCVMDVNTVQTAVTEIKALNAKPRDNGYYAMVAHPIQVKQLMRDSIWQNAYQYTDAENLRRGQAGRIMNVEVFESTNILMNASGTKIHNTTSAYFAILLGKGALGVSELDGGVDIIVKRPNEYDTANPLNQWSSIGWKINFVPAILNSSCGRIVVTANG